MTTLTPPTNSPTADPALDARQRFFFADSPVRGDTVRLRTVLDEVYARKDYPEALQKLLGEMLVVASLLASTLKFEGRLSVQMQGTGALSWAMAECDHQGGLRALAHWQPCDDWQDKTCANDAFAMLEPCEGDTTSNQPSVLFINIEPKDGKRYQSVVERTSPSLAGCLQHFQNQSAQIATHLQLACDGERAGGIMLQKLPDTPSASQKQVQDWAEPEDTDQDLWQRLSVLTATLSNEELLELPAKELLYRLYHEEEVTLPKLAPLRFACTCSHERCLDALSQLGLAEVQSLFQSDDLTAGELVMDCQFCGLAHRITKRQAYGLFELPN